MRFPSSFSTQSFVFSLKFQGQIFNVEVKNTPAIAKRAEILTSSACSRAFLGSRPGSSSGGLLPFSRLARQQNSEISDGSGVDVWRHGLSLGSTASAPPAGYLSAISVLSHSRRQCLSGHPRSVLFGRQLLEFLGAFAALIQNEPTRWFQHNQKGKH